MIAHESGICYLKEVEGVAVYLEDVVAEGAEAATGPAKVGEAVVQEQKRDSNPTALPCTTPAALASPVAEPTLACEVMCDSDAVSGNDECAATAEFTNVQAMHFGFFDYQQNSR